LEELLAKNDGEPQKTFPLGFVFIERDSNREAGQNLRLKEL
jgi:hypothetical protein